MECEERQFSVSVGDAPLIGTLMVALIERTWPGCKVGLDSDHAQLRNEVLVRNRSNGRTMSVFVELDMATARMRLSRPNASAVMVDATAEELQEALGALLGGSPFISPSVSELLCMVRASEPKLSAREREVLQLVVSGLTNREVAAHLGISSHTVRSHIQRISEILGVSSRAKLAVRASELGLT